MSRATGRSVSSFPNHVPASFKYGGEAMALMGIAYGLIKWIGRTLRSLGSDTGLEAARVEGLTAGHSAVAADMLVRQGIVSAAELERMTPREREFLVATAGLHLKTAPSRPATQRQTPASTAAVTASPRVDRNREPNVPPRLHLITPTRPPLGMVVHCPGCGAPLDRDALQRVGATTCPRCKRPVSAHIQRGRLTVIIEETADEAAHRRRVDGDH